MAKYYVVAHKASIKTVTETRNVRGVNAKRRVRRESDNENEVVNDVE